MNKYVMLYDNDVAVLCDGTYLYKVHHARAACIVALGFLREDELSIRSLMDESDMLRTLATSNDECLLYLSNGMLDDARELFGLARQGLDKRLRAFEAALLMAAANELSRNSYIYVRLYYP